MESKFFFNLKLIKPQYENEGGSLTLVTSKEVPGLVNLSFINLTLKRNGVLEPIWHPNAHKIGYCTQGNVCVSIRTPADKETFTVHKGDLFFIPKGYVHSIENLDENNSVINFALNHSLPEVMHLSQALDSISNSVFNSTFNTPVSFIENLKKSKIIKDPLKTLSQSKKFNTSSDSKYKFNIENSEKPVLTKGGYVQVGTRAKLPILEGLGILGFGLNPKGVVEPHWHTNAGELVYIVKGKTRITVLAPDGHVDVLDVSEGEGAFAPASHFHNIENIGPGSVEVIAFFSDADPDYIGIGEVVGTFSNEILSSIFNVPVTDFDPLKKPQKPLVIVPL